MYGGPKRPPGWSPPPLQNDAPSGRYSAASNATGFQAASAWPATEVSPAVFVFNLNDATGKTCREQVQRAALFSARNIQLVGAHSPVAVHGEIYDRG